MPDDEKQSVLPDNQAVFELTAELKRKLDEVEALRANLEELAAAAQTKLSEINLAVAAAAAAKAQIVSDQAELGTAAQAKLVEVNAAVTVALAAKTRIIDDQTVIATKSTHIQGAQEHADKVRAELDRLQTSITQQATEAEGHRNRAQTAADSVAKVLADLSAQKSNAEADAGAVVVARDASKAAAATTKELADKSQATKQRLEEYEAKLEALEIESKAKLETITGLLPGATSAGLAHSFDDRRKTFLKPSARWQRIFIAAVLCIVGLAGYGLWQVSQAGQLLSWNDLARLWIARLPIAGALIWLALHAGRESALAKRLEEDYGYKAAIAASFQGFYNQMAATGNAAPEGSPLAKLCGDTLATIGSPPGRIYEKHQLTITPTGEFFDAAGKLISVDKLKQLGS